MGRLPPYRAERFLRMSGRPWVLVGRPDRWLSDLVEVIAKLSDPPA
jgi:hypothetical protein